MTCFSRVKFLLPLIHFYVYYFCCFFAASRVVFSIKSFHSIYITALPVVLCTYVFVLALFFQSLRVSVFFPPRFFLTISFPLWVGNFIMDSYSLSDYWGIKLLSLEPLLLPFTVFFLPFAALPSSRVTVSFLFHLRPILSVCLWGWGYISNHRVLPHGLIILVLLFARLKGWRLITLTFPANSCVQSYGFALANVLLAGLF